MKTMSTPTPLLHATPSKNLVQDFMLSTNNTSSLGKSSHNSQFDGQSENQPMFGTLLPAGVYIQYHIVEV